MIEDLKRIIYNQVIEANRKLTPGEVEQAVAKDRGVDRKTVKLAIKDLVSLGELSYTYLYGTSFLERSFDRPIRVSRRLVIKPPDKAYEPQPGEVILKIAAGAAFGNGAHPTTRLAMRALDAVLGDDCHTGGKAPLEGLDIGTGTGILAIALAKLGVRNVVATDIDPCAVSEATHNVLLNGLTGHVRVTNSPLQELATHFSIVVANLAYPTLSRLSPLLSEKMEQDGVLVLSGFKEPVSMDLSEAYADHGLRLVQKETDREWVCLVFRKPGLPQSTYSPLMQKSSALSY
jgi:ribosomal protein L11 methyltransferase